MDTFDALIDEAERSAQEADVPFETALMSVLSGEDPAPRTSFAAQQTLRAASRTPLVRSRDLAAAVKLAVPIQMDAVLIRPEWLSYGDAAYRYAYVIRPPAFTANMRTGVYIAEDSGSTALEANMRDATMTRRRYGALPKAVPKTRFCRPSPLLGRQPAGVLFAPGDGGLFLCCTKEVPS